ncbi:GatB/YqeY domain-containing protein [Actinomycetospora flava]|uniref:GatB/YqeY domain-containing protein n=1 Tax=Actinomycetospora flava TaxID=3129232 RepID=A0ABU8MBH0_9PSEU
MSDLKERLRSDLTTAMKARDQVRVATIRMALSAINTEEVAGDTHRELTDDEVVTVLGRESKKRRESAEAFDGAGRTELAERERAEQAVLTDYLPSQLSDEELTSLVAAAIAETGAEGPKQMGQVMKVVQPQVAGRADGRRVSGEVKRQLSGS